MKNRCKKRHGNRKARKLDFYGFLMILEPFWVPQTEPIGPKIDVERASKFDKFWEPSWNATFSAQEAPRGASAADRRRKGSPPGATGEGFRMGNKDLREVRNLAEGLGSQKKTW